MIGGKTVPIGQITLANFTNPAGLIRIGNNLFQASAASGAPQVGTPGTNGLGTLQQGASRSSNVNEGNELVNLLIAQQSYAFNAQALTVENEMLTTAVDLIA